MLELTTPKARLDAKLAGEFRPKKLESWLASLPRTDREAHAKWLRKALWAQNRVVLPASVRLALMELYMTPFQEIYTSHQAELRTIATIPLHPHFRSKETDVLELLDALATGYKIAAVELSERRRGQARQLELALALQRAVYCLGQVVVTSAEIYLRPPGDTWRELHGLYRCAEQEELQELEVPATGERDEPPRSVLETYLQVLLVGASSPPGLLPGEVRRLYDLAPQWCTTMKLTGAGELPSQPGHFRVNLKSDAPPLPLSKTAKPVEDPKDENIRILRTLGVARSMHEILTSMNEPATRSVMERVFIAGLDSGDGELFRRAGRVLGEVNITRGSTRFSPDQDVEFASGFEAVLRACNGGLAFDLPPAAAREPDPGGLPAALSEGPNAPVAQPGDEGASGMMDEAEPETGDLAGEEADELFIDLAEPMMDTYRNAASGGLRADDDGSPRDRALPWVYADNQSAGGLCLVAPRSPDLRLKVGDIAACRMPESRDWQLGTVRWMRVGSKEIKFGMQFLGPVAFPVAVAGEEGGHGADGGPSVFAAIWLPESPALKKPNSIVLPRRAEPYPPALRILGADDLPAAVRLHKRIERTGDYEQFLVSLEVSESEAQRVLSS